MSCFCSSTRAFICNLHTSAFWAHKTSSCHISFHLHQTLSVLFSIIIITHSRLFVKKKILNISEEFLCKITDKFTWSYEKDHLSYIKMGYFSNTPFYSFYFDLIFNILLLNIFLINQFFKYFFCHSNAHPYTDSIVTVITTCKTGFKNSFVIGVNIQ